MDKEAKEALFNELYQLDKESSSEEDTSNISMILRQSRCTLVQTDVSAKTPKNEVLYSSRPEQSLLRTASAPLSRPSTLNPRQANAVDRSSCSSTASSRLSRKTIIDTPVIAKKIADMTPRPDASKTVRKRKRGQSLELKPESQQIFRGLGFYFIPNNDISEARKRRIRKAMEWGALWIRELRDGVTHLIVDRDLCYQDVLKALKITSLPPNVVLVNEVYPADCLMFKALVNAEQSRYRVPGHDEALIVQKSSSPAASSETSLQLKPEKADIRPPTQTPSRSEGSGQTSSSHVHKVAELTNEYSIDKNTAGTRARCREQRSSGGRSDDPDLGIASRSHSRAKHSHACPQNDLDQAIKEAQATKNLPLDTDEDESSKDRFLDGSDGEHSEEERQRKMKSRKESMKKSWQDNFSCMSKHDGTGKSANPNARTIEILQQMADYYEREQDHWRLTAYRRAIAALRKQDRKITTEEEAFAIPSIGARLAAKIEEIVWTNKLRRLDNTGLDPNAEALQLFMGIYGVGLKQATKWVGQGHRTLPDLEKAHLTKNQRIGVAHYEDFKTRIPRAEMDRHDQYVRETCNKIDETVQVTIGGSYRRGAPDSGDVDFIVTKPDAGIENLRTIMLGRVIPKLFEKGYLKVGLATTDKADGSKWHGAAALPGTTVWRRIDFLLVPWDELGAALIYFTGNDIFNRSIRLLASKKGMRLNQRGLWKDVIRGRNRERITQGSLVEGKDEKKIFELLGVPWRPPQHRIC